VSCVCQSVVKRAYKELRARGCGERDALVSVLQIYRLYHPETDAVAAIDNVSAWLDAVDRGERKRLPARPG